MMTFAVFVVCAFGLFMTVKSGKLISFAFLQHIQDIFET